MKAKTKRTLSRVMLYTMIFVFIAGTFLLYLPLTQPQPESTAPPLENLPEAQQQVPPVNSTGAPLPQ